MNGEVNTLMMCSNKSRWDDVEIIINKFSKTHNIQLWIDEADKSVGGIDSLDIGSKRRIEQINNWKPMIHSINLITATPFSPKSRWSNFKWIGQNFGGVVELVRIPEIVGENYHHLCESRFVEQEDTFDTPAEYAKSYLDKNPAKSGDVLLIPGTTRQASHDEVKDMCLNESNIDCVIVLNGKIKGLYGKGEDGDQAIICDKTQPEFKCSLKNKNVATWLGEFYKQYGFKNKKVVITGNLCISRGITISSPACLISHIIFGCDGSVREEEQLLSRVCGYCYSLENKPIVVCPLDIWNDVSKYQEVVIELSKLAMSENQEDLLLTESKLNSIIQNIDKHKRIPRMVDGFDGSEDIFVEKKLNKEQKIEFFKEQFPDLVNFMKESKCKQITMPKENGSYKKHVEDVFKKVQENKNFVIDFTPSEKESNCWMGIVDSRKNRLFVITWVVDSVNL